MICFVDVMLSFQILVPVLFDGLIGYGKTSLKPIQGGTI